MVKLASLGGMEVGRETQDFFLLFFPPVPVPVPTPPPPHVQLHSKISNLNKIAQNFA